MPKTKKKNTRASSRKHPRTKPAAPANRAARNKSPNSLPTTPTPIQSAPGKRLPMGEALRAKGLDELALTGNYAHVVDALKEKSDETGSVEKPLVDVLKECAKHLDDAPASRNAPSEDRVVVQRVHNVARPNRAASSP